MLMKAGQERLFTGSISSFPGSSVSQFEKYQLPERLNGKLVA
jgi:hypothetical protein